MTKRDFLFVPLEPFRNEEVYNQTSFELEEASSKRFDTIESITKKETTEVPGFRVNILSDKVLPNKVRQSARTLNIDQMDFERTDNIIYQNRHAVEEKLEKLK